MELSKMKSNDLEELVALGYAPMSLQSNLCNSIMHVVIGLTVNKKSFSLISNWQI
jgi:hypothetical protein